MALLALLENVSEPRFFHLLQDFILYSFLYIDGSIARSVKFLVESFVLSTLLPGCMGKFDSIDFLLIMIHYCWADLSLPLSFDEVTNAFLTVLTLIS